MVSVSAARRLQVHRRSALTWYCFVASRSSLACFACSAVASASRMAATIAAPTRDCRCATCACARKVVSAKCTMCRRCAKYEAHLGALRLEHSHDTNELVAFRHFSELGDFGLVLLLFFVGDSDLFLADLFRFYLQHIFCHLFVQLEQLARGVVHRGQFLSDLCAHMSYRHSQKPLVYLVYHYTNACRAPACAIR